MPYETDVTDFRRVKEVEALARSLGFKLDVTHNHIVVYAGKKGFPAIAYGEHEEVNSFDTVVELRGYLKGIAEMWMRLNEVEFDLEEYVKRVKDIELMDTLKGKRK